MSDKANVLGTVYTIERRAEKDDKKLEGLGGYTDVYKQLIVIRTDWNEEPNEKMLKDILRHEIIHAFAYESGLWDNSNKVDVWATNEEMIDWIALQGLKIYKAWAEAGAV